METVIRVFLFYVLEKFYNNISAVISDGNCGSNTTTITTDQPDFCLAGKSSPNSTTTNLFHILLISMLMIFVTTPRQALIKTIMWVLPLMLMLWSLDFFYDGTVTLNKYSKTMLRIATFTIVCYWIYHQTDLKYRPMCRKFNVFKWLIPIMLLFWSFDCYYDCNQEASSYFLMTLRVTAYLIVNYSLYDIQHVHKVPIRDKDTAIFFLLITFGLGNVEFQYLKYLFLIRLMPSNATNFLKINILSFIIWVVIELPFLNCMWDFQSLIEMKCLEEVYHMESITIVRSVFVFELLPYFNKLIFEAVQNKCLPASNFDFRTVTLDCIVKKEFYAIDCHFLKLNTENQWATLQLCFLINFGELLVNFSELAHFTLVRIEREKKLLANALIISLFTLSCTMLMIVYSLMTFTFSLHLFIIVILAVYVTTFNILSFARYAVIEIEPFKNNVEMNHQVRLIDFFLFFIKSCLYISLTISCFLIAVSEEFSALSAYLNWHFFANRALKYINGNKLYMMRFVKARKLIYFISESKPQVLNELKDVCSICHEKMLSACKTLCNHHYHKLCLLSSLYEKNMCPICRCELYTITN